MNVRVVQNPDNQISVFTGNGQQLVANSAGLAVELRQCRDAVGDGAMERRSEPGRGRHHHADVAGRHQHRSSRRRRHSVGRNRRLCADARQHPAAGANPARRDGEPDVAGVVEPDDDAARRSHRAAQAGFSVDVGGCFPGNTVSSATPTRKYPAHRDRRRARRRRLAAGAVGRIRPIR